MVIPSAKLLDLTFLLDKKFSYRKSNRCFKATVIHYEYKQAVTQLAGEKPLCYINFILFVCLWNLFNVGISVTM